MTIPDTYFIIDRKNVIDQIHVKNEEIIGLFEEIEAGLSQFLKKVDADNYTDSDLKCQCCELEIFTELLEVFAKKY